MTTIGLRIKQKREERGWSQRELAAELKQNGLSVDSTAVSRIENDERDLRTSELAAISLATRSPIAWLMTGYSPDLSGYANGYCDGLNAARKAVEGLFS